ncbi:hypothetical protein B0H13DRAFT_2576258 [Mycena leptocephala]|nr:hypothetical protein B0H13DRAFT_2576258 [Mycena leptocephala]
MDTHPYFAFSGGANDQPIATSEDPTNAGGQWPGLACNSCRSNFGVTIAGEFSNGYNDCVLYLRGVNGSTTIRRRGTTTSAGVREFALASMDALGDWFFLTWKIGKAADGVIRSPLWYYQLGLEGGWMPTDPCKALGKCASIVIKGSSFDGTFSGWQTGGAAAGTIDTAAMNEFGQWPPATISNVDAGALTLMPTYTETVSIGNGWFDAGDTTPDVITVAGCMYPAVWTALNLPAPTALCTGAA